MRLLLAQNALDAALSLYDESKAEGFLTEMAEIKGDILLKQGDTSGATTAYIKAYDAAPSGLIGPLLKIKMENIGIDVEKEQVK
jgi:predicted negative regulator of RcsB-dependent stress response